MLYRMLGVMPTITITVTKDSVVCRVSCPPSPLPSLRTVWYAGCLLFIVQYSNIIQQSTQITIKNKTRKTYI